VTEEGLVNKLTQVLQPASKEQDKANCPAFPTVTNLRNWLNDLCLNLVHTSRHHDDEEIRWLKEVTQDGASFEVFADSGLERFNSLDRKLSQSAVRCIEAAPHDRVASLKNKVNTLTREALNKNTILKGRQVVFLIVET
jgi:hypothetical protein